MVVITTFYSEPLFRYAFLSIKPIAKQMNIKRSEYRYVNQIYLYGRDNYATSIITNILIILSTRRLV